MNTNETLKYTILTGLFAIPFIPFIISSSMLFPFISGKNFTFRVVVLLISVLWVILALREKEYRPKKSVILWSFLFFLGAMGVATLTAVNPAKAFWSNFERMEGYIGLIHLFLYFIVLSSMIHAEKLWERLWATWIGSSLIMCIYGTVQLTGGIQINQGGVRVDGTLGNATYLAVFLMSLIFFAGFLYLRAKDKTKALLILGPIALYQMVILYFTATRGAILGLIGGVLVTAFLAAIGERENKKIRIVAISILVSVVVLIGGFISIRTTSFVQNNPVLVRFASLTLKDIQSQGRFFIWPMAIEGFKEKPITGWGQEGFNYVFNKNYDPRMYAQEQWFDRAHSAPLDWLIAGGFLGFLGYAGLLVFSLLLIWRNKNGVWSFTERSLLTGFLAAYFFQSIFVFDNLVSYLMFFTFLAMVHSMGSTDKIKVPLWMESKNIQSVIASVFLVLSIGLLYVWNIKPIHAGQNLISALRIANSQGKPQESLMYFEKVFDSGTFAVTEAREQFASAAPYFLGNTADQETKRRYSDLAIREMQRQIKETPEDTRAYLVWGGFFRSVGQTEMALEQYTKALELSPRKQVVYLEIGSLYLQNGLYEEALTWFKDAYLLETQYTEAKLLYAIAALYAGDKNLSDELLASIPENDLYYNDRYINVLIELKDYEQIATIFSRRITDGADTFENTASLTAAYLQMGRRADAVKVLRRYADLNPKDAQQINYYITEIEAGRNP